MVTAGNLSLVMAAGAFGAAMIWIVRVGARPSEGEMAAQVRPLLQRQFDARATETAGATVHSVDVVHESGNTFAGIAHIERRGVIQEVVVDIVCDRNRLMAKIPPGVLVPLYR